MFSRRSFLGGGAALFAATGFAQSREEHRKQGDFDDLYAGELEERAWTPFSDRKVRVGQIHPISREVLRHRHWK